MSILRVRDDQGNYVEIPAIKGEPGASGVIDATTESALTGLLKGAGGHIAPAVAGTDYVAPADMAAKQNKITASGLLKGDGDGGITAAVAGTDYAAPASVAAKQDKITASGLLKGDGSGGVTAAAIGTDYAPAIDYIVDQGTIGAWTYRKWNSGTAECWCKTDITGTTLEGNKEGGTYFTNTITIPLPIELSDVSFSGVAGGLYTICNPGTSGSENITFRLMKTSVETGRQVDLMLTVHGKWK